MIFFKNFVLFATLTFVATLYSTSKAQAQTGSGGLKIQMHVEPLAAAYIKFDGVDGECTVKEGRNTVGRNTRTGDNLIVVVKKGKLVEFGVLPARGAYKALPPNAAPCFTISCTTFNPPKCFTLSSGECVCVCGPWITAKN